MAFIKADRRIVDGMGDDASYPRDFGRGEAPPQRVAQQCRPQAATAPGRIDRKTADQQ